MGRFVVSILPTSSFIVVYLRDTVYHLMIIHKQWGCNCAVCLFLVSPLLWRCVSLYSVCLPLIVAEKPEGAVFPYIFSFHMDLRASIRPQCYLQKSKYLSRCCLFKIS